MRVKLNDEQVALVRKALAAYANYADNAKVFSLDGLNCREMLKDQFNARKEVRDYELR